MIATATQYVLLIVLTETGLMAAVPASNTGFAFSALINYWLNYHYTFSSTVNHRVALLKFTITALVGLSINFGLMSLLVTQFSFHYLLSQVMATGAVLVWNFLVNRAWTFQAEA